MLNIEIDQAKDCLPDLIEQTIKGNDVIISRKGHPLVKIVAICEKKKKREFGSAKGLIKMSDDFDWPLDDFKEYM
jgi:antitoxin (DNA-binding transcriptional repressor) of toxin-antitoxin stability system